MRRVAYETLSKRERRARHLAAARMAESNLGRQPEEIVEVLAAHYLEAYRVAPEAAGAAELKGKAGDLLVRAGRRAASLAASEEARHYFEQAAELADRAAPTGWAAGASRRDGLDGGSGERG